MSARVCVLASWEIDDFANREFPDCRKHKHIKLAEAREMTSGSGFYTRPVAEWVGHGERRIAMIDDCAYRPHKTETGHVVLNRLERWMFQRQRRK